MPLGIVILCFSFGFPTVSSCLGGNITFAHVTAFVDDVITVTDEELVEAAKLMYEHGFVCETSGVASIAAAMSGKVKCEGRIVCVVSGSNISRLDLLEELDGDRHTSK